MKKIFGKTKGLKSSHLKRLVNLYRRRVHAKDIISYELCLDLCCLSKEINKQIGLLISRTGKITHVILGDSKQIFIPNLTSYRLAPDRLRGVRCIHTHLDNTQLTKDDLTDLSLLHLDMMAAITVNKDGSPNYIYCAHLPYNSSDLKPYTLISPIKAFDIKIDCLELIKSVEKRLSKKKSSITISHYAKENAILVSIYTDSYQKAVNSLNELKELSITGSINVLDTVIQRQRKTNSKLFIGQGKLDQITLIALNKGASIIIFDQELTPSQNRIINDRIELKIIDRTQLILDIFAQRAQTREGKIQVELAQLKYMLPRLVAKNMAMSRLTGGIGGRGPGETKLEINRRRARNRIHYLEKTMCSIQKIRKQQGRKRERQEIPIVSILGYTNSGKSTLLNKLTHSHVLTENKLFATLDPTSRRMKFPKNREIIITDTVGFIRNLPKDLMASFRATLEELKKADLLIHLIDISNPRFEDNINSVESILSDLALSHVKTIKVFNKKDLSTEEKVNTICKRFSGIAINSLDKKTLTPLIEEIKYYTKSYIILKK